MKVPVYEKQVGIQTPKVGATQIKQGEVPSPLPAAYGADIGQAAQVGGKAIVSESEQLASHYDTMQKENERVDNLRRDTGFRQDLSKMLYSNNDIEVDSKDEFGKDIKRTVKEGLLLRASTDAKAVSVEYKQKYAALKDQWMNGANSRQLETLDPSFNTHGISANEQVIKHELAQRKVAAVNTVEQSLSMDLVDYGNTLDPVKQRELSDNMVAKIKALETSGALDYDQAEKKINKVKYEMFLTDFRNDAEKTEKSFLAGDYGMDIETAERARVKLKELKTLAKETETTNFAAALDETYNGNMTIEKANMLGVKGVLNATNVQKIKVKIIANAEKLIKVPNYKAHKKAIDLIMPDNRVDRSVLYDAVLEYYDGESTKDEVQFMSKLIDLKKDVVLRKKLDAGASNLMAWFRANPKTGLEIKTEVDSMMDLARRIVEGKTSDEAFQDAVNNNINREHPGRALNPDASSAYTRRGGQRYLPIIKSSEKSLKTGI